MASSAEAAVPPVPADPEVDAGRRREGPVAPLALPIAAGVETLGVTTTCEGGHLDGATLALLSPRLVSEATAADAGFDALERVDKHWLTADLAPGRSTRLGRRARAERPDEELVVPSVEVVGVFPAAEDRPAIAMSGRATIETEVRLGARSRLRASVAMDRRVAAGTGATLTVSVDNREVERRTIDSGRWRSLDVDLGAFAGRRRLTVTVTPGPVEPAWIEDRAYDGVTGEDTAARYRVVTTRVGLAAARIETVRERHPRRASPLSPSVILVQIDTLRADARAAAGDGDRPNMPALDALALRGVDYRLAFATSPWTSPSTATLLTGRLVAGHGVVDHDRAVLPALPETLAEVVQRRGVRTGAVVANPLLDADAGYARGFDRYAYVPFANARQVTALAESFLSTVGDEQYLLFLHYIDPHGPYNPPLPWRDRYLDDDVRDHDMGENEAVFRNAVLGRTALAPEHPAVRFRRARYAGAVAWMDRQLDRLLSSVEARGLAPSTAVVVTSDHGEEFFEHGIYGHGNNLYDETLQVPLVVARAGALQGWSAWATDRTDIEPTVVGSPVTTASIFAETLALMGLPADPGGRVQRLFAPALPAVIAETEKAVYFGTAGIGFRRHQRAARDARGLVIERAAVPDAGVAAEVVYYDLSADPQAEQPLAADSDEARALRTVLERGRAAAGARLGRRPEAGVDRETMEALRGLGYVED